MVILPHGLPDTPSIDDDAWNFVYLLDRRIDILRICLVYRELMNFTY